MWAEKRQRSAGGCSGDGRARAAATVHTLVLAYAGTARPLLLALVLSSSTVGDIWNREMILVEALRAVAGGVGLALAMPLTTWLACLTCRQGVARSPAGRPRSHSAVHVH